jgi:hypothetical protein
MKNDIERISDILYISDQLRDTDRTVGDIAVYY